MQYLSQHSFIITEYVYITYHKIILSTYNENKSQKKSSKANKTKTNLLASGHSAKNILTNKKSLILNFLIFIP